MILRRITEHVKTQNWFAVGLDFVIVVVGVFIGIQVANWNESRIALLEEQAILARLAAEYRDIAEKGDAYLVRSAQQRQLMARWIDAAEDDESLDLRRLRALFVDYYESEAPDLAREMSDSSASELFATAFGGERRPDISITFQQLVTSGDFRLIRSERVRSALLEHSAEREEAVRAIGFNHGAATPAFGSAFIQSTFQAGSPNPETVLEEALIDPEFTKGLRAFYGMRVYNENWFLRVHEITKRVLVILESEVETP